MPDGLLHVTLGIPMRILHIPAVCCAQIAYTSVSRAALVHRVKQVASAEWGAPIACYEHLVAM